MSRGLWRRTDLNSPGSCVFGRPDLKTTVSPTIKIAPEGCRRTRRCDNEIAFEGPCEVEVALPNEQTRPRAFRWSLVAGGTSSIVSGVSVPPQRWPGLLSLPPGRFRPPAMASNVAAGIRAVGPLQRACGVARRSQITSQHASHSAIAAEQADM